MSKGMKYQAIVLIAIILLGFFLRFIDVSNNPPGLYIDEVSIGYNAYSILTTGKDEYGVSYPLWFRSFGDFKLPLYIYAVVASMAVLGKTELAIRLPSVIAGTLTILVLYLFLKQLLSLEQNKEVKKKLKYLPLLASLLLAISSWHIHFSRGGFEVTLGTFLYIFGWYLFLLFKEKKSLSVISLCLLSFITTMYTYDAFRLLTPIALLFIGFNLKAYKNHKFLPFIFFIILLLLPIILFSITSSGRERFHETSTFAPFNNLNPPQKIVVYPLTYLNNYLSFYSLDFLFNYGDGNGRHQIPNFGELYRWQLPFFLGGIYILLKQKKSFIKNASFLLFFSTPLAAAVAVPSPHTLRSLPLVIPCIMFIAIGLLFFIQSLKRFKLLLLLFIGLVACYEFFFYLHFYYVHYPNVNQLDWGAGYKQLVITTAQEQKKYKYIIVDKVLNYAPIYFNFYDKNISFSMIASTWKEPRAWNKQSVLYIRPYYGTVQGKNLIKNIYLTNNNHDIFAQLWEIK